MPANDGKGRPHIKSSARSLLTIFVLLSLGLCLIFLFGRKESARFTASFKSTIFSPGTHAIIVFSDCNRVQFRPKLLEISADAKTGVRLPDNSVESKQRDSLFVVAVTRQQEVSAELESDAERDVEVEVGSKSTIEAVKSVKEGHFGRFKVWGDLTSLTMTAWGITLKTDYEPAFFGFADAEHEDFYGSISVDQYEDSQGGVPPTVQVRAKEVLEPIDLWGKRDSLAGWNPVSIGESHIAKPISLNNARCSAENVSFCDLSERRIC